MIWGLVGFIAIVISRPTALYCPISPTSGPIMWLGPIETHCPGTVGAASTVVRVPDRSFSQCPPAERAMNAEMLTPSKVKRDTTQNRRHPENNFRVNITCSPNFVIQDRYDGW